MKQVLLYSGGLDSMCAYHLLKNREGFEALYIPHDGEGAFGERTAINYAEDHFGMKIKRSEMDKLYLDIYEDRETGFIPLRNLLFACVPAMEGASRIFFGAVKGEYSLDKSDFFYEETTSLFTYLLGRHIIVQAPLRHLTKTELVREALASGEVTEEMILSTHSCYHPDYWNSRWNKNANPAVTKYGGCGQCMACVRRWIALIDNDIEETYDRHPSIYFEQLMKNGNLINQMRKQPVGRWLEITANNLHAWRTFRRHKV